MVVCKDLPSNHYFDMQTSFLRMCAEDMQCHGQEAFWTDQFAKWSVPSDRGWCTFTLSDEEFIVDDTHPFPGTDKKWKDVDLEALRTPSESQATIKAYFLKMCKKHSECKDDIGKWERKLDLIESKMTLK